MAMKHIADDFDWNDIAFGKKKPINDLAATFIAAPRTISVRRFAQLVKTYLAKGNVVLGIAKEPYVDGFDGQPQFETLAQADVQAVIDRVREAAMPFRIYTLRYFQRDMPYILEKLSFTKVVCINGSWQYSFHTRPAYYQLANSGTPYELVSPFADEDEAKQFAVDAMTKVDAITPPIDNAAAPITGDEQAMFEAATAAAQRSFDHTFQTGAILAKQLPDNAGYMAVTAAHNQIVPYETYAMHFGASREKYFSPPNDLNHYDTVHAETMLLVKAAAGSVDLSGTTLFINLLPCPHCARMLSQTEISEIVYSTDHSDGYAVGLLEAAGKTVRRFVPQPAVAGEDA